MKALFFVFSVLISQLSFAGKWISVPASDIDHVRAEAVGGVKRYVLQFKSGYPGDTGCETRDFVHILGEDGLASEMYSTALAGFLANRTLFLHTTGCDSFGNIVQIVGIK